MTKQETHSAQERDTVLLVDDEPHVLSALTRCLRKTPYQVFTVSNASQALEIMETTTIKVIVSDEKMEGMQGSELLAEVQRRFPHTSRILLTGYATLEIAMRTVNESGIFRFLTKPCDDSMLLLALSAAIEKYKMEAKSRRRQETLLQSEERYRTVVEKSPQAVVIHRDATILYANSAAIRMFGATSLEDLLGKSFLDRIHPDERQEALKRVQMIIRCGGRSPLIERRYLKFDGTVCTGEIQGTPIIYDGLPAIHLAIQNITDRKQSEKALQDSHDLLEQRVGERTGELWNSNEALRAEINTRKRAEKALNAQAQQLEETNTALKVLLHHQEAELQEMEKKVVANIQKLVLPYIGELKQLHLSPGQSNYLEIMETNLQQVIDPFLQNLAARFSVLTPREIQMASLIKEGKTNKEIAVLLNASLRVVEFHRNNIRKKLGLSGKKTNLCSFLLTLS